MFDILMTKLNMSNKLYILGRASGIVEDVNRGGRSQATNVGSIPIARSLSRASVIRHLFVVN